jgi:hypothetical protein
MASNNITDLDYNNNDDDDDEMTTNQKRKLSVSEQTSLSIMHTDEDPPPPPVPLSPVKPVVEEQTSATTVVTAEPVPNHQNLIDETTEQLKKKICLNRLRQLNTLRLQSHNNLSEQYYLEQNYNYLSYTKFLNASSSSSGTTSNLKLTNDLKDFLNKQFPHDLNCLELKLANKFHLPMVEIAVEEEHQENKPTSSSNNNNHHNQLAVLSLDSTKQQQQSIAERAKHEAQIIQRITQLRKEGLWSIKRLPKLVEPQRIKSHWDFLLDEMTWMATDFQQERKWKKNSCKKLSIAIQKYFKDKELKAELAEREETKRMRKQASLIARDIMQFWRNVEKIIEYKQLKKIEEKRKQAMDLHLNFIVDQTEKYSSWLIESLATSQQQQQQQQQQQSVTVVAEEQKEEEDGEVEYESEIDDESTIEKEEELEESNNNDENDELKQLQLESELPIEDLLKDYNLDENYFITNTTTDSFTSSSSLSSSQSAKLNDLMDVDVVNEKQEEEEEEEEIEEEHDSSTIYCTDDEEQQQQNKIIESETKLEEEEKKQETEEVKEVTSEPVATVAVVPTEQIEEDQTNKEVLNTIAAQAQSLQPTGYTLETTNVKTKVPSLLLKHTLREYQHVGLDWLVTINENKLNGILADEMGLGKTIQTIALLAHLAVEKGVWGPHLIVVPTSVMLNWELEFKKWCPGFKILTYYGSPKDRKLKRQVNIYYIYEN